MSPATNAPANAPTPLAYGSGTGGGSSSTPSSPATGGLATYLPLRGGVKLAVNSRSRYATCSPLIARPCPAATTLGSRSVSFSMLTRAVPGRGKPPPARKAGQAAVRGEFPEAVAEVVAVVGHEA